MSNLILLTLVVNAIATLLVGAGSYRPDIQKYQLIKETNEALYRAKAERKNKVC